jgi:23S rRNA (adenine2503-C2)-methyltransferase
VSGTPPDRSDPQAKRAASQSEAESGRPGPPRGRDRSDLRALDMQGMEALLVELGERPFRARQIHRWVHARGVRDVSEMTDLSKDLRQRLADTTTLSHLEIERVQVARDGTRKYAMRTSRGDVVESVLIPDASAPGRHALCISSQVGCAIDCKFCLTATLGLVRNLTAGEISEQLVRVQEDLGEDTRVGNIVMMGMGEPLHNYENLVRAISIMTSDHGPNVSARRITVSTAGLASRIPRLGTDTKVNLAVSLNATTDEVRSRIMPINDKWNIAALLAACREFPLPERRRITFEYVLLEGINDSLADARRLVKLLGPFRCKVNLIPFNEHPGSEYRKPKPSVVDRFQRAVTQGGLSAFVRTTRGDDISAACGQLGVEAAAAGSPRLPVLG